MIDTRKHILLLNRSFWPDIEATGQFYTELCSVLAHEFHVTVVAGSSYYVRTQENKRGFLYTKEILNGFTIIRVHNTAAWKGNLFGRLLNWCSYSILAFPLLLKIKTNFIIIGTDPPFLGILALCIKKIRSIPYLFYSMDVFPDVAIALGKLNAKNIFARIFDYFNRKAMQNANFVICLGESMKKRIGKKKIPEELLKIIPLWVDTEIIKPLDKRENQFLEKYGLTGKFIILYSGNIGLSQDFESLLEAFQSLPQGTLCLVFIGDGAGKRKLQEDVSRYAISNVLFLPYQPKESLSVSLGMADLHIITLKKGLSGSIVPSKMHAIMATGKPYFAMTDADSEPALFAIKYGCGLWAAPDDVASIREQLIWAMSHPGELQSMGKIARHIAQTQFDKNIVITQWLKLLKENLDA